MKLLVFGNPNDPTAQACVEGLSLLGHKASYRNPTYAKAGEVEVCDMIVADMRIGGRRVLDVYEASEIPAIRIEQAIAMPTPHTGVTLDTWGGIVPVECPTDRRERMGLMSRVSAQVSAEEDEATVVTLLIDGTPFAEIEGDESVESVAARIAYSMWTREELSSGAPFEFILDVIEGKAMVPEVIEDAYEDDAEEYAAPEETPPASPPPSGSACPSPPKPKRRPRR